VGIETGVVCSITEIGKGYRFLFREPRETCCLFRGTEERGKEGQQGRLDVRAEGQPNTRPAPRAGKRRHKRTLSHRSCFDAYSLRPPLSYRPFTHYAIILQLRLPPSSLDPLTWLHISRNSSDEPSLTPESLRITVLVHH
jgi:hypothetical protein